MQAWRPRQFTRRCLSLAMLAGLAFLFTGCLRVEFSSEFDRDGTTRHSMSIVIPREEFEAGVTEAHLDLWEEVITTASESGLNPVRIDDGENVTFQVAVERPDGDDAGAALNSLLNATGLNPSPGISAPFQGSYEQRGTAVGGTEFVLEMTVNGPELVEALSGEDEARDIPPEALDDIVITYEADIPGVLNSSTADDTSDDRLRWEIDKQAVTELHAQSSAGRAGRTVLFLIAAAVSLAAVVVAATVVSWMLVRRPALASGIGSAARHFPRRTTITDEGLWVAYRVRLMVERFWHTGAPHGDPPVQHELLDTAVDVETEGDEDGPDTEGDRPPAGVCGG